MPNDVRRFMKRISKTGSGEKAVVEYILALSQKRYKIEDCFRIIKMFFTKSTRFPSSFRIIG